LPWKSASDKSLWVFSQEETESSGAGFRLFEESGEMNEGMEMEKGMERG
jgi:hypothetical protein